MKKLAPLLFLALLLWGCGSKSYETVSDVYVQQPKTAAKTELALPEDSSMVVLSSASEGTVYLCDGYCVAVTTLLGGDLDATLQTATGFPRSRLSLLERQEGETLRYECAWAAAGEGEDQIARAVVLDDGSFHYVLTVMGDARSAGKFTKTWQQILDSFQISTAA